MSKSLTHLKQQPSRRGGRRAVEPLEARLLFYSLSGMSWANTDLSYSFMPDGTVTDGGDASKLFAKLNAVAPTATWQREFAEALQTWANATNLNFHLVADDGSAQATAGQTQGDTRFGDLRYGTRVMGSNVLGYAYFPSTATYGATSGGDVAINTSASYSIGGWPDLYSVLLHETGHALGLMHSTSGVMAGVATSPYSGLAGDDIAGIQAIYGARRADAFDLAGSNDTSAAASALTLSPEGGVSFRADLTSMADVDFYGLVAPSNTDGKLTISVDARGLSLLAPKLMVYDAAGNLVGTSAGQYGAVATLNLSGLTPGQRYVVVADGATGDVFGMGAYKLSAQFGQGPVTPTPTPPPDAPHDLAAVAIDAQHIDVMWGDVEAETQYVVERSLDGVGGWTHAATVAADVTRFSDSGVTAGVTYFYRVIAANSGGASAASNVASATTPTTPPDVEPTPTLPPAAPTGLTFTKAAKNKVKLTWADNAADELGYIVERSTDGGLTWTQFAVLGADATSYIVGGGSGRRGSAIGYRVVAYNDAGTSDPSNVVTF